MKRPVPNPIKCLLLLLLLPLVCQAQKETLVFSPHWIPQAQFAAYYVAQDQGFYRDAGLEVQIVHSSADVSSFELLKNGRADVVSSFLMDAIKARAKGLPLVNIAQLSQHSALMLVAMKKNGINRPEDLQGKKIGIWTSGFDDIPFAFMREKQIDMQVVRILNTVNLFLAGGIDVMTVMNYNEYDQIINSGVNEEELSRFHFADYGYDIPEDGLYCLESTLQNKREALGKFVQATLKGWEYAAGNKEYTLDLVIAEMNKAHLPNNRAHQRWMLDRMLELITPGDKATAPGQLLESDFNKALKIIRLNSETESYDLKYENFYRAPTN